MKLIYQPEGEAAQEFVYQPTKLLSPEAEAIEKIGRGGWWDSYDEFGIAFMKGNMRAKRAVLFIMLKRQNPGIRFEDISFAPTELLVAWDDEEQQLIREAIKNDPDIDDEDRVRLLREMEVEEFKGENPLGEAQEKSEAEDTSLHSTDSPPVSQS
jgi:hypothetical protein